MISKASRHLATFELRLKLARAAELARAEAFHEAESILKEGVTAEELDLLARIHVQQGNFHDARRRWEMAICRSKDPEGKYRNCLSELNVYALGKTRKDLAVGVAYIALFALGLFVTVFLAFKTWGENGSPL